MLLLLRTECSGMDGWVSQGANTAGRDLLPSHSDARALEQQLVGLSVVGHTEAGVLFCFRAARRLLSLLLPAHKGPNKNQKYSNHKRSLPRTSVYLVNKTKERTTKNKERKNQTSPLGFGVVVVV